MKHVFLAFAAVWVLGGCSVANTLRMMNANSDMEPVLPASDTNDFQQSLPAFYIGEKPYIKVTANDQEELLFLIDTGASFTMLFDTEKTARLKFERGFSMDVRGWGDGEHTPAYQTQLDTVSIGDVSYQDVKVAYIPISTSQYYLSPEEGIFDGVLGHDLLRHFNWMFDKKSDAITLSTSTYVKQANDVQIPIDRFLSKLSIPVTMHIDGRDFEQDVYIDTGSRHYFKFNTAYVESHNIKLPSVAIHASDFGMSGEAKHTRIRLPALNLGKIKLEGLKANVIKAEDEDDYWVIGSALMNQFVTIIDYQNEVMTFRPYENQTFITKYNLAGLDLRKLKSGLLVIRHVYPELVAAQNGFTAGAVVTSINGQDTRNITEEHWLEMVATPGTFEFCFQKQPCASIKTKHIEGYSIEVKKE